MEGLWLIAYIILGIIAIWFILAYFTCSVTMINPNSCDASTGTYGVRPGTSGTALVACDNQACIFSGLNLTQAVNKCDSLSDVCSTFSYEQITGTMTIIDPTKPTTIAPNLDLYQRRVKII